MTRFADTDRLDRVTLHEENPPARSPEAQQDLDVALYDLGETNRFRLTAEDAPQGPYALALGMTGRLLMLRIESASGETIQEMHLSLSTLRPCLKDYAAICESYVGAVSATTRAQIETIDMARRAIHDEGSTLLMERLEDRIATDFDTARRLFTVVAALQVRG